MATHHPSSNHYLALEAICNRQRSSNWALMLTHFTILSQSDQYSNTHQLKAMSHIPIPVRTRRGGSSSTGNENSSSTTTPQPSRTQASGSSIPRASPGGRGTTNQQQTPSASRPNARNNDSERSRPQPPIRDSPASSRPASQTVSLRRAGSGSQNGSQLGGLQSTAPPSLTTGLTHSPGEIPEHVVLMNPSHPPFIHELVCHLPFVVGQPSTVESNICDARGHILGLTIDVPLDHGDLATYLISRAPSVKRLLVEFDFQEEMHADDLYGEVKRCLQPLLPLTWNGFEFGLKCAYPEDADLSEWAIDSIKSVSNAMLMVFVDLGLQTGREAVMRIDNVEEWCEGPDFTVVRFHRDYILTQ